MIETTVLLGEEIMEVKETKHTREYREQNDFKVQI